MSRIDDLIAEHCPRGVEFRSVSAASIAVTMPGRVKREDYHRGLSFPVVDQSLDFIAGYTDEESLVAPKEEYVVFGDHTRAVKYVDFAFAQGADGVKVLRPAAGLGAKWLYYCLANLEVPSRGYNRHWTVLREMRIPVPPISIQREIVSILDKMEALQTNLRSELQARSLQYEFYLDQLMEFGEAPSVKWMPMGEVGEFIRGRRFTKADYVEAGIPCIHYGEIYTKFGPSTSTVVSHVREEMRPTLRFAEPGDVVIVDVGETVADVGKAVAWLGTKNVAIHDHCYAFRHNLDPSFVSYYMQTSRFHAEKAKHVARTKVKTLLMNGLAKVKIPVPPRDEQERIVAILDRFDALVHDLSVGLPGEIEARRQQYEYYLDKLLTFPERPDAA